ncbi:RING finger protein 112 isoform X1 [Sarcophilus harrisii]|uniref:RING finger protein 112 n=2 Tax=Sarcophilus harrisii TaxID=9305 RepID=G3WLF8_SARHA|nr:RING finger protein 112 isoform X1 [Sarcophilus harrisii]
MENRNDHLSSSLPGSPSLRTSIDTLDLLTSDLTCSICWELFRDPVSLECGHNFCAQCITCHWASRVPGSQPPCCPVCRMRCDRRRLVPDTRLRSLTENMNLLQQNAGSNQKLYDGHSTEAKPLQLVRTNSRMDFTLCLESLTQCLNHPQAKDNPVCIISVLGEQRTGKSFLLNYLISGMQGLEAKDLQWMKSRRALQKFQCEPGAESITKGLWIWSQPFVLEKEGMKVAVFLVDSEGSISIEQDKEMNAKLIALSMLLSSHQILNVSRLLKDTDLEYLEMFLHIAEEIGEYFKMEPIQHLDLLVRDWFHPATFGKEAGQKHMIGVFQKISGRYPRIQKSFKNKQVCCYLLPFPGIKVASGGNGDPEDMDPNFCHYLHDYITGVCSSATQHLKKYSDGHILTGRELAENITKLFNLLKKTEFGFSSSYDSVVTQLHDMKEIEAAKKELEKFVEEQDSSTKPMLASINTLPTTMWKRLSTKKNTILDHLKETLKSPGKSQVLKNFEEEMQKKVKDFQDSYKKRFCGHTTALGGLVGAGILALAGGIVGIGVAASVLSVEAAALATGATVGATVAGGGIGAGIGAAVGKAEGRGAVPEEEEENLLFKDDEE